MVLRLCRLSSPTHSTSYQGKQARYHQLMTEPWPTLAGYGEVLVLQQDLCGLCSRRILSLRSMAYTTRFGRTSFYRTSQLPRSTSLVSKLLQPSVALLSTVGTSYRKTIMTHPQTRNSYRIDRCAGERGLRAGVTIVAPDFDKFVTERNRRQPLKCKWTINLSTFNVRNLQSIKQMPELIAIAVTYHIDVINVQNHYIIKILT